MTVDLAYDESGPPDAPVLVLSNSIGATGAIWEPQLDELARRFRVIRVDTRGHGRSPVPDGPYTIDDLGRDALALLDRLGAERVSWAGVSLGGMIGMWVASHAPERIDRLVLCCTSPKLPSRQMWIDRAEAVLAAGTVEVIADAVLERWLSPRFHAEHPDETAAMRAMFLTISARGYAGCCNAVGELDLRDALPSIAAPTLVISGDRDPATPTEGHGQLLADRIPDARLAIVPGSHIATIECPEEVTSLMVEHLGGRA